MLRIATTAPGSKGTTTALFFSGSTFEKRETFFDSKRTFGQWSNMKIHLYNPKIRKGEKAS